MMAFSTFSTVLLLLCFYSAHAAEWNYADKGPESWVTNPEFPNCARRRQSPVNIELPLTRYSTDLTPFDASLFDYTSANITYSNNGHTVGMLFDGWTIPAGMANLTDDYKAVNLHMHWGSNSTGGSEHTFNNEQTFAELHFVHYNTKYGSLGDAVDKSDGLAVLGIMVRKQGTLDNPAFQQLLNPIMDDSVKYKDDAAVIPSISFGNLFPRSTSLYYRYLGSLTTPDCLESVTWTVFNDVIVISEAQADALSSKLYEYKGDAAENRVMINNFRPVRPLAGRLVHRSQLGGLFAGGANVQFSFFLIISSVLLSGLFANLF